MVAALLPYLAFQSDAYERRILAELPVPGVAASNTTAERLNFTPETEFAQATVIPTARGFTAVQIRGTKRPPYPWGVEVSSPTNSADWKKDDVIFVSFEARTLDSERPGDVGFISTHLQQAKAPWEQIGTLQGQIRPQWRRFAASFRLAKDWPAGTAALSWHLGHVRQSLELGGVVFRNLGPLPAATKLPFTRIDYPGMEPSAPWRKEAARRIERYRKGDLAIRVVRNGKPVANADVRVDMVRNAFEFGSFVESPLLEKSSDGERYRSTFRKMFNKVTVPMYWADWGWPYNRDQYLAFCDYFQREGVPMKAHVLIYPGWTFLPAALKGLPAEETRRKIFTHIDEKLAATRKYDFVSWDILNELRDLNDLPPLLGETIYADIYKHAHRVDPRPIFYLNENTILTHAGFTESQQDTYESHLRKLISDGAPVEGIGFQGHFGDAVTGPETVWRILDRFAKFRLPMQITEFDLNTDDEEGQAAYTRDFLTAIYAHPAMTGFTMWGFWEKSMWTPKGGFYRSDWSPKPNALAWDRLMRQWRTDATVRTGRDGEARIRAFTGSYRVRVGNVIRTLNLTTAGMKATIIIK